MTPTELDLARRLAAVPGIWRRGMMDTLGRTVLAVDGEGVCLAWPEGADQPTGDWFPATDMGLPDLTDPATRGALLDVARERWGDPLLHVRWSWTWKKWYVYGADHRWPGLLGGIESEGAAIALAILGAP